MRLKFWSSQREMTELEKRVETLEIDAAERAMRPPTSLAERVAALEDAVLALQKGMRDIGQVQSPHATRVLDRLVDKMDFHSDAQVETGDSRPREPSRRREFS